MRAPGARVVVQPQPRALLVPLELQLGRGPFSLAFLELVAGGLEPREHEVDRRIEVAWDAEIDRRQDG